MSVPAKPSYTPQKTARKTALLLALCLLPLAACRSNPQGQTPSVSNPNLGPVSGPSVESFSTPTAPQIVAAKSRVPHQYREEEALGLFDYATNLNPASNRSVPAN